VNRLSTSRFSRLIALLAVLPAIASAHPGHDGGHDLTWDFGNGLGHVHYGQALLVGLLLVGAGVGIAKLAARFFKN
jgi:urease accessory protein